MNFKRIIAAMDFTDLDKSILLYLKYIANLLNIEDVCFIHITKILALPKSVEMEFGQIFQPDYSLDQRLKKQLIGRVDQVNLPIAQEHLRYEIHEGNPVEEIIHWADLKKADLVIFGRKVGEKGSGLLPRRMAHRLKSSILFVPQVNQTPIQSVLVPLDFSENSKKALQQAMDLKSKLDGLKVTALHVVENLSHSQYPSDSSLDKYIPIIQESSQKEYMKLIQELGIDENSLSYVQLNNSPYSIPAAINNYALNHPCDLIMIGAKGHSKTHIYLYGSTTERFVEMHANSPILVIR